MCVNDNSVFFQLKIAIVNFVADCNLSFNITQSASFREMLEVTAGRGITIPTSHEIKMSLISQCESMKTKLIRKLSEQPYVCVTCDIWSSRAQSYFCMTIHFINSEFKRESYVLAFRQMKYKQTNKEITDLIRTVFREYKISPTKVTHIVTDGGSSFCKAFKVYGRSVDTLIEPVCDDEESMPFMQFENGELLFSNVINLGNDDNFESNENSNEGEEEEELEDESEQNDLSENNSDLFDQDSELLLSNNEVLLNDEYETEPLPSHRRCLSHLLNLIGKDFEDALDERTKKCWIATLNKLQAIWVFPRKSAQAKTYSKDILGCALLIPCVTRWNSKFDAVSKILSLGHEKMNLYIDTIKQNLKSASHLSKLEKEDWLMISIYVKVMKPVAVSLDKLQAEIDSSQGFILPTLFAMKHHLTEIKGGNLTKSMRDTMLNVIEKRFSSYFRISYSNMELVLGSVSNPRFKLNFIESDVLCSIAKEMLISECRSLALNSNTNDCENLEEQNSNDPADDFFISFPRRTTRRTSCEALIEDEVNRFVDDSRTNYSMLNNFPNIKNVYFKHNTTLSASAAVERVFNQSNMIFTPTRNRLSAENFECLLLYKHNRRISKE